MGDREAGRSMGLVGNIQRYSLHDGGGIRTVAFLKGCPFRCPWCCNPEDLSYEPEEILRESLCIMCSRRKGEPCPRPASQCPTGAKELVGIWRDAADLADLCARDGVFYEESGGGATLSGGEALSPCYQEFAARFFEECDARGVDTAIETTLSVKIDDIDRLVGTVGKWLVDFKIADEDASRKICGVSPNLRDENARELLARGAEVIARMPIIPGYTDSHENVLANIERIEKLGIKRVDVLPFHQLGEAKYESAGLQYSMASVPQLSDGDVEWIMDLLESKGLSAVLHGE